MSYPYNCIVRNILQEEADMKENKNFFEKCGPVRSASRGLPLSKLFIFSVLLLVILTGCAGVIPGNSGNLTIEQVQQYARQTLTAQADPSGSGNDSGGLLIRPVLATPTPYGSGFNVISTPETQGVITRPIYNVPTTVPTAAPYPRYPVYQQPTATSAYAVPNYAQPVNTVCERVRFVDDVTIPDNTQLQPGQTFRKVWRVQNAGSCAWSPGYQLVFAGGDAMGSNLAVNLPRAVAPGDTVDLSIDLTAPGAYGVYQSNWKLRSPAGNIFGTSNSDNDAIWVKIVVGNIANISTVAPGITPVNTGCTLLSVDPAYRASFERGEETDFIFRVRNNSNISWTPDDMDIAYIGGENMLKRKDQTRKDLPEEVAPGGTLRYALDGIVPTTPGVYTMTMGIVRGYG